MSAVRRLAETYEPEFRARLTVRPDAADDGAALATAASRLTGPAAGLLDLLWLCASPGEPIPERLRVLIDRDGDDLWRALLLLPRATHYSGGAIHPGRYAASCRLNPALSTWRPRVAHLPPTDARPAFPVADAWWDAIVVAAAFEANPGALTQDGALRKDVERRILGGLGEDSSRWDLALRLARVTGLVRNTGGRLVGLPEAIPRPVNDPSALCPEALSAAAASVLMRIASPAWTDWEGLNAALRDTCREIFLSPRLGRYPDRPEHRFDDDGWTATERGALTTAVDILHRVGILDVSRSGESPSAVRIAGPRPGLPAGFLLTPDLDILAHAGELSLSDYGRLSRLAPYVDGARLHRHRLTREGVTADIGAGHSDIETFLSTHSRTGLPPSVGDTLKHWQRSAQRITATTGVDIEESEDGTFRILRGTAPEHRTIDYSVAPRGRFLYHRGRISIIDGWDPLTVRAVVSRVARYVGREGDERIYVPELRAHANPASLLELLRAWFGGELPGEIEAMILAGTGVPPASSERALIVHLPPTVSAALRRDRVVGPLLRRSLSLHEFVVEESDVDLLRARLGELGISWV